jgi:hypothetical protein
MEPKNHNQSAPFKSMWPAVNNVAELKPVMMTAVLR